tara:strand:+ start:631 stop:1020 length:390 start_codon:yes stop_codon:yes gene_type:complete
MAKFCVYKDDGAITRVGNCISSQISVQAQTGETAMQCDDNATMSKYYVLDNEAILRPIMGISISSLSVNIGVDVVITGIPEDTIVTHTGGSEEVDDGDIEWSSNTAGNFELKLVNFPYKTEVVKIEVTT